MTRGGGGFGGLHPGGWGLYPGRGGLHRRGALAVPPSPTGTRKVGDTHPTGMLPCFFLILRESTFKMYV